MDPTTSQTTSVRSRHGMARTLQSARGQQIYRKQFPHPQKGYSSTTLRLLSTAPRTTQAPCYVRLPPTLRFHDNLRPRSSNTTCTSVLFPPPFSSATTSALLSAIPTPFHGPATLRPSLSNDVRIPSESRVGFSRSSTTCSR